VAGGGPLPGPHPGVRVLRDGLQAAAGRADAVRRTLALLEARLSELDLTPGASTRQLAATLLGTGGPRNSGSSPQAQPSSTSPGPAGDGAPGHLR